MSENDFQKLELSKYSAVDRGIERLSMRLGISEYQKKLALQQGKKLVTPILDPSHPQHAAWKQAHPEHAKWMMENANKNNTSFLFKWLLKPILDVGNAMVQFFQRLFPGNAPIAKQSPTPVLKNPRLSEELKSQDSEKLRHNKLKKSNLNTINKTKTEALQHRNKRSAATEDIELNPISKTHTPGAIHTPTPLTSLEKSPVNHPEHAAPTPFKKRPKNPTDI